LLLKLELTLSLIDGQDRVVFRKGLSMDGFFRIVLGGAVGAVLGILFVRKQTLQRPGGDAQLSSGPPEAGHEAVAPPAAVTAPPPVAPEPVVPSAVVTPQPAPAAAAPAVPSAVVPEPPVTQAPVPVYAPPVATPVVEPVVIATAPVYAEPPVPPASVYVEPPVPAPAPVYEPPAPVIEAAEVQTPVVVPAPVAPPVFAPTPTPAPAAPVFEPPPVAEVVPAVPVVEEASIIEIPPAAGEPERLLEQVPSLPPVFSEPVKAESQPVAEPVAEPEVAVEPQPVFEAVSAVESEPAFGAEEEMEIEAVFHSPAMEPQPVAEPQPVVEPQPVAEVPPFVEPQPAVDTRSGFEELLADDSGLGSDVVFSPEVLEEPVPGAGWTPSAVFVGQDEELEKLLPSIPADTVRPYEPPVIANDRGAVLDEDAWTAIGWPEDAAAAEPMSAETVSEMPVVEEQVELEPEPEFGTFVAAPPVEVAEILPAEPVAAVPTYEEPEAEEAPPLSQPSDEAVLGEDLKARIEETRRRIREELEKPFAAVDEPEDMDFAAGFAAPPQPAAPASVIGEAMQTAPVPPVPAAASPAAAPAPAIPGPTAEAAAPSGGAADFDAMKARIELTRSRLKAKAFDAMMAGESALLGRNDDDAAPSPVRTVSFDSEIEQSVDSTLTEEDR
jgi:hypothetical protein